MLSYLFPVFLQETPEKNNVMRQYKFTYQTKLLQFSATTCSTFTVLRNRNAEISIAFQDDELYTANLCIPKIRPHSHYRNCAESNDSTTVFSNLPINGKNCTLLTFALNAPVVRILSSSLFSSTSLLRLVSTLEESS